ncbi:thiolase family protein [Mycobacterium vicinigordonae]|uniref:Acetyl-CoA C-acyltransferase n=1 Tax=Mycobacterium vicinigordonae TaxID=1719132 RepID=A0A7D6IKJ9_9MYCO|nr:acetyl-CoA C-acyltransferase [Mycobacterium vicinigordonae]QLL06360.1 acetyl-CoA C-acyltransferase [Mycobacterium vicinigordonae]
MSSTSALIIDAIRTPGGRREGNLSGWHPVDLAATVLSALTTRSNLDPGLVDDVIMGCVTQVGHQAFNIGRSAVLAAGFPEQVPATTVDRQCGSSQQSVHFAAQGVIAGAYDIAVAAGVEVMSTTPMGASKTAGSYVYGPLLRKRYKTIGGLVPQGISAEMIADRWNLTREELDTYGARSQQYAARARDSGRFDAEILPVAVRRRDKQTDEVFADGTLTSADEGIRPETTLEMLATLKPAFKEGGKITAGTSSQICDGSAAVLIASERAAARHNLRPRARVHTFALAGVDPVSMLTGPIPATQQALKKAGLSVDDIDVFEVNEAFASVILAWEKEIHPDMERVNVNGGAIALGHPLGASGAKLMATMLNELERCGGRYGLQTMCEGGGMANATIIERIS